MNIIDWIKNKSKIAEPNITEPTEPKETITPEQAELIRKYNSERRIAEMISQVEDTIRHYSFRGESYAVIYPHTLKKTAYGHELKENLTDDEFETVIDHFTKLGYIAHQHKVNPMSMFDTNYYYLYWNEEIYEQDVKNFFMPPPIL